MENEYKVYVVNEPQDVQENISRVVNQQNTATVYRDGVLYLGENAISLKCKLDTGKMGSVGRIVRKKLDQVEYRLSAITLFDQLIRPIFVSLSFVAAIIIIALVRDTPLSAEEMFPMAIGAFIFFFLIMVFANLGRISFKPLAYVYLHDSGDRILEFAIQDQYVEEFLSNIKGDGIEINKLE